MTPTPNTGLKEAVERVTAFLDHCDARPNALIHKDGRTLSRHDLRLILSALPPVVEAPGDREGELSPENRVLYFRVMGAKAWEVKGHPDEWDSLNRLLNAAREEGRQPVERAVREWAKVKADADDFDGDRRGIIHALREREVALAALVGIELEPWEEA